MSESLQTLTGGPGKEQTEEEIEQGLAQCSGQQAGAEWSEHHQPVAV